MPNVDDPRGLILYKEQSDIRGRNYPKTAVVLYRGDLVKMTATGEVAAYVAGDGKCLGVAGEYQAAAATEIYILDDPQNEYTIQTGTTVYLEADNGLNVDIEASAPDTNLNNSGQEANMATKAVTATLPLKIIRLADPINQEENTPNSANATIVVQLNNTVKGGGDGSTGI